MARRRDAKDATALLPQEVGDELFAMVGEDGFGVELDAFNRQLAVAESHNGALAGDTGRNFELVRDRVFGNDERVIARAGHRLRKVAEDGAAVMSNNAGLAVHQLFRANHFPTKGCTDGLMAEADAEERNLLPGGQRGKVFYQRDEDTGFLRGAGSGRKQDVVGVQRDDFFGGDFVVAFDDNLGTEFTHVLDEVVGEGVVIVENEDHTVLWYRDEAGRFRIQVFGPDCLPLSCSGVGTPFGR